ncbi:hypothetical protein ACQQ2N_12070 [Dokdonella sp. MW10]|uniref:hypothetical protein n=1 Tax=Dokdonella sp. MW10 TaxID=2992926 RepID=UPI003F7E3407
MFTRTFATLNDAAKGPALELDQGALIVTCSTISTNRNRMVRGTVGRNTADGGVYGFECVFYASDPAQALASVTAVGLATATTVLTTYAGGTGAQNIGLLPGDGQIHRNAASIQTVDTIAQRVVITVVLDASNPAAPVVRFYANGAAVGTAIALAAATTYYPAVTVGSATAAYDLHAFCSFGQRKFKRPIARTGGGVVDGWYEGRAAPRNAYLIPVDSGGALVQNGGSTTAYAPRITNGEGFSFTRACSVWQWGGRTSGTSFGNLELDNRDGLYDFLCDQAYRDATVRISILDVTDHLAVYPTKNRMTLATGVLDSVESIGEDGIRIRVKDTLARLQKPLQTDIFLPYLDAGVANTPVPITLGACRNVQPVLTEQTKRTFVAHDAPLTNIGRVRDRGAPLSPYSTPPQYVPSPDLDGITLETMPIGKLTMDCSSVGSQVVIPGAADVLAGAGEFNAWPNPANPPTGWTSGGSGTVSRIGASAPFHASLFTSGFYEGQLGFVGVHLRTSAHVFQPGKNYRITFKIASSQGGASSYGAAGVPFGMMLRTDLGRLPPGAITPNMRPISAPNTPAFQNYTFTFSCPAGSALPLYIIVSAPQSTITGVGAGPGRVEVYDVKIELLGQVTATLPLDGIGWTDMYRELLERRGGLSAAEWDSSDTSIIDNTPRPIGLHIRETNNVQLSAAALAPLDSITGAMFTDAEGRVRIREFIDPRWWYRPGAPPIAIATSLLFDTTNTAFGMQDSPDNAPGLTTAVGARKNWSKFGDSDFVSDFDTVPAATRAQFRRDYQLQVTSTLSMSAAYAHAVNAPPLGTLFDSIEIAGAMLDRTLYSYSTLVPAPRFKKCTVFFDSLENIPIGYFGDYVLARYPRFGMENGVVLAVVDATYYPHGGMVDFTIWGGKDR